MYTCLQELDVFGNILPHVILLQLARQLSISINESESGPGINSTNRLLNPTDKGPNCNTGISRNQYNSLDTPCTPSANSSRRSSYVSAASRRSSAASETTRRSSNASDANVHSRRGSFLSDMSEETVSEETPRRERSDSKVGKMKQSRTKEKESHSHLGSRTKVVDHTKLSRRKSSVAPVKADKTKNRNTPSPKLKQKEPSNRRKSVRLSSDSHLLVNKPGQSLKSPRRKSVRLYSDTQIVVSKRSPSPSSCKSPSSDQSDSESQQSTSRTTKSVAKRHSLKSNGDGRRKFSTVLSSSRLQPIIAGRSPTVSRRSSIISQLSVSPASSRRSSYCSEKEFDVSTSLSLSQSTRFRSRRREVGFKLTVVSCPSCSTQNPDQTTASVPTVVSES